MRKYGFMAILLLFLVSCGGTVENGYSDYAENNYVADVEEFTEDIIENIENETSEYMQQQNLNARINPQPTPAPMHLLAWQEAYLEFLEDYQLPYAPFFLFDIDGNGIPELIIAFANVYTFRDGNVVALDNHDNVFDKYADADLGYRRLTGRLWQTSDGALVVQYYYAEDVTYRRLNISGDAVVIEASGRNCAEDELCSSPCVSSGLLLVFGEGEAEYLGSDMFRNIIAWSNILDVILAWQPAESITDYADYPAVDMFEDSFVVLDISQIPYFGNRENFNITARHAMAFAEAVKNAELDWGDSHFGFEVIYPVLIDVVGDGVPLLLLAERGVLEFSFGDIYEYFNMLYGYKDGEPQKIAGRRGIGIFPTEYGNMLSIATTWDFGVSQRLYRVDNGAAELFSVTELRGHWHTNEYMINGVYVSQEEAYEAMETAGAEIEANGLLLQEHPMWVTATPVFENYPTRPFTRESLTQIFINYAWSLPPCEIPSVYTVAQIQAALQPNQFAASGFGENAQVISVQRVERLRDYLWFEPAGEYMYLTNTARYRVTIRDDDDTISTSYRYFIDENGTPVLAFVIC